eukprot:Nitzschia sp. Nitz4//scaffold42_size132992//115981//117309//NITZ4_003421-RA/size132992-processed-gene-0.21-mRNA-1//1//CDS//3329551784//2418//frame0
MPEYSGSARSKVWVEIQNVAKLAVLLYVGTFAWACMTNWQQLQQQGVPSSTSPVDAPVLTDVSPDPEWWLAHESTLQELLERYQSLAKDWAEAASVYNRHVVELETSKSALENMAFGAIPSSDLVSFRGSPPIVQLLKLATLSDLESSADLHDAFARSIRDLSELVQEQHRIDWVAMSQQLHPKAFGTKQPSVMPNDMKCPAEVSGESDTVETTIPDGVAREKDLELKMKKILETLKRRQVPDAEAISWLAHRPRTEVQQATTESIDNLREAITKLTNKYGVSGSAASGDESCVSEAQVEEMMDASLKALQHKADVRNVLRKKVLELDPNIGTIILDADLPLTQPSVPVEKTVNLRRILDGVLVSHYMPKWIDHLVELSGGYNDNLDQWLDSLVAGRESVGAFSVRYLLEESSKVDLPTFQALVEDYVPPEVQVQLKRLRIL